MIVRRCLGTIAAAVLALLVGVTSVSAQTTTATVSGTVKDGQGGVIPGAYRDPHQRITRHAPRAGSDERDRRLRHSRTSRRTPTASKSTMSGFKTLKRPGIVVGAGDSRRGRHADDRSRRHGRDGRSQRRVARHPGDRAASDRLRSRPNRSRACRSRAAASSRWRQLAPGVNGTNAHRRPVVVGRRQHQLHDGRRVDDGHGQQLGAAPDERRVDRRSESPRLELPGRVRPVERPAGHGRDEERHATASADRSTTSSATRTGIETRKTNILNGDPKTISKQRDWGYSIGGPIGKPGGSNKLFFFYSHEFMPRAGGQRRAALPRADSGSSGRATSRRRRQQRQPVRYIRDPRRSTRPARPAIPAAVSPMAASLGKIPADRLYQTDLNILNMFPMPTIHNVPAGLAYNYENTRPTESAAGLAAGDPRRLQRVAVAARDVQVLRLAAAQSGRSTARFRASTTRRCRTQGHGDGGDGQLQPDADDVPGGDVRAQPERAGRLRPGAGRHRSVVLPERVADESDVANRRHAGLGGLPMLSSRTRWQLNSSLLRVRRRSSGMTAADVAGRPHARRRRTSRGAAASPTRRRTLRSPATSTSTPPTTSRSA